MRGLDAQEREQLQDSAGGGEFGATVATPEQTAAAYRLLERGLIAQACRDDYGFWWAEITALGREVLRMDAMATGRLTV